MSLPDIFAVTALVISLLSFGFTYRIMRDQFTEDTGADLHKAVMKLIEIQGSMPDHQHDQECHQPGSPPGIDGRVVDRAGW
jgi:hypothetical protein